MLLNMRVCSTRNVLSFDETVIKTLLKEENQFLTNLWDSLPIPYSSREQIGDDDMYLLPDKENKSRGNQRKVKIFKPGEGGKQTVRAKSLEELYAKRNALKGSTKLKFKDKLLKKGLKHKITKQRRKQERKMRKNLQNSQKSGAEFGHEVERKMIPVKPVFNSEGKMVFSKFDFTGSEGMVAEKRLKESQNPKLLLEKLQKQKEKLQHLESQGKAELAAQIKEKEAWKKALKKAHGEKVKDDVELLKKSVRKVREQKLRSKKKWEDILAAEKRLRENKEKKRTENLLKRKKDVKKNKLKKAAKKGRVILSS